ncbi:MAG: putative ABC transporter permease [Eggerthellaceae bacterium]|nr:putative ABC transporter permease [Eggerthellaceae bacterium]
MREAAEDIAHPSHLVHDIRNYSHKEKVKIESDVAVLEHPVASFEHYREEQERKKEENEELKKAYEVTLGTPIDSQKLPIAIKILGIIAMAGGAFNVATLVLTIFDTIRSYADNATTASFTLNSVVTIIQTVDYGLLLLTFVFFGWRLLRNKRHGAAVVINLIFIFVAVGVVCSIMLYGVSVRLISYGILIVLAIVFQTYLDPSLAGERRVRRKLHRMEIRDEAAAGTLGYDETGKGYITLNFYNLFWIFVVCSIIGLIFEDIFHILFVDPGHYQDRAGLLFGPFSPIYGCGAVLMTIFLNRFHKANIIIIFLISAVIGGAFEYFTSLFMQYAYGAVAWNYTGMWLSIGGRTCGLFMAIWGALGVLWIKLMLPIMLRIINLIPWNWRYVVTTVCAILMAIDIIMSLQALDCWYERLSGEQPVTAVQKFYAKNFDNKYMEDRFQSMTINPKESVRSEEKTTTTT